MRHSVETKVLNEVLQYLQTRPFHEVNVLIAKLTKSVVPLESTQESSVLDNKELSTVITQKI
jgi:hypothetical protein